VNQLPKKAATNQFHDDVWGFARIAVFVGGLFFASVIDPNDGWVCHAGGGLSLLAELRFKAGVIGKVRLEKFDCDSASEASVVTLVNLGHAATAH
jgi:hypothetical protein